MLADVVGETLECVRVLPSSSQKRASASSPARVLGPPLRAEEEEEEGEEEGEDMPILRPNIDHSKAAWGRGGE